MSRCVRCDLNTQLARGRTSSGGWQVFRYCFECKHRIGGESIPHRQVPNIEALPIAWDHIASQQRGICEACFREAPLEYHHVAPRHLFGEEAEFWPGLMICVPCHNRYHRMVTPLMSMPAAVSEILAALPEESPIAKALRKSEAEVERARKRSVSPEQSAAWRERRAATRKKGSAA